MQKILLALLVATASSLSEGQQSDSIQLHCAGYQEDYSNSAQDVPGTKKRESKTFSLRIDKATGLAQIDGLAIVSRLDQSRPFTFIISDAALHHQWEFTYDDPKTQAKTQFASSLSIDRYSGVARENQRIVAMSDKGAFFTIFTGEYQCKMLQDKLF